MTSPAIKPNRWKEDWSSLADPALRLEPFDRLKYVPLWPGDPESYFSLGLNLRERIESENAPVFGVGHRPGDSYLLHRFQFQVDVRPAAGWQIFSQFEDDRAPGKAQLSPVDADKLDL